MNSTRARCVLLASLLIAGACETTTTSSPPKPYGASASERTSQPGRKAEITNEFTATAEVVAVNAAERSISVRREDGTQIDLVVDERVRNLDQVKAGDALRLRYRESLTAEIRPSGENPVAAQGAIAAARAKPGEKPGAGVGVAVRLQVKIESIDEKHGIVVFSPASGELIAHRVVTPEGRDFLKHLVVGDSVQLDYLEAVALDVTKL